MPNRCGVVNCQGNYNKKNKRRVFHLLKEQSQTERQKWLDVIPRHENFVVDPDKFFICEIHWSAYPPLIKLHGGSVRPGIPPSIFNVPASCLPSPKPAPHPAKVEDQQLRYFLQMDKITSFDALKPEHDVQIRPTVSFSGGLLSGMAENNRDCKVTSILCVMMKSLHKGPRLMISDTRPQANGSIPA
ncbi:Zinc finger C2CH-type [Trinorchestia longiramus]|nr:Zinc finger C2CH-type [Trinorchestia longiramus]